MPKPINKVAKNLNWDGLSSLYIKIYPIFEERFKESRDGDDEWYKLLIEIYSDQ